MDLRALECFLAVAAEGSISRAATALHMTQPPLSVRLRSLERELGVTLLVRHGRGVDLTAAGRLLADRGRRLTAELALTVDQVRAVGHGTRGSLTIAIGHTVSPRLLRPITDEAGLGDDVDLRLVELADPDVVERVHGRDAHVGLLHLPPNRPGATRHALGTARGLEVAVVGREPMVAVLPDDHPSAGDERIDLTAVGDARVGIASGDGTGLAVHVRAAWDTADGRDDTTGDRGLPRHQAVSVPHALSLVEAGAGVALLPAQFVAMLWPGLVARPLLQHTPVIETAALWRPDEDSPVVRRFLRAALATPEPDVLGPALWRRTPRPD